MNVVAIYSLTEDKQCLGGALAAALGVTAFEALSRLRAPGNGPFVVAVLAERDPAVRLTEKLRVAGFQSTLLEFGEISAEAGSWAVRRFRLGEEKLHTEALRGDSVDIPYRDIRLILRGTGIVLSTSTENVKNRSFSLGRAVLSGGLMLTKTTKSVRETTKQEREGFFIVYGEEGPSIAFHENGIVYDSLGIQLKPASAANFAYLVGELRRRCEGAAYDERLLTRTAQAALLGPRLSPETHLTVATALLAKVLRGRA